VVILFKSNRGIYSQWSEQRIKLMPDVEVREYPDVGSPEAIEMALIWEPPPGRFPADPDHRQPLAKDRLRGPSIGVRILLEAL
jgi:glyoxylate/hydroxypyruvate reductase A